MSYQTTELELAAFLKARGHRLLEASPQGRLVSFAFVEEAAGDAQQYFAGAEISARELFEAHRHLRALIQQLKQHINNQNGKNNNEPIHSRS
jgi:predicted O-methyltransferase YrrM